MATEIILALVLSALFCGAVVWLAVYSRLQGVSPSRPEQKTTQELRQAGEVKAVPAAAPRRAVRR